MGFETITLSDEEAKKIREDEKNRRNRAIEADAYDQFTEFSKPYFFESIKSIEDILTEDIITGKLGIDTIVLSRIKDQESALNNDDLFQMNKNMLMRVIIDAIKPDDYNIKLLDEKYEKKEKALDDVFGITVIIENEEEKLRVQELISQNFIIDEQKMMQKEQYKAIHLKIHKEEDPQYPLIECQIKTRLENINSREHTVYKVESAIERKLRKEGKIADPFRKAKVTLNEVGIKKVYTIIQEYFNEGLFTSTSNIPKMWESRFNEFSENMQRSMLTEGQTLKRMYKFLNMSGARKKEGEQK